jgi:hypothetical protein
LRRPGGVSGTGGKGEKERRGRALYRHGGSSVKAGIKEELREEEMRFTAGRRQWKKRLEEGDDRWVHLSARGRE